mgnify:FL=1
MTTPLRLCAERPTLAEARATAVGCLLRMAPFPVWLIASAPMAAETHNETEW